MKRTNFILGLSQHRHCDPLRLNMESDWRLSAAHRLKCQSTSFCSTLFLFPLRHSVLRANKLQIIEVCPHIIFSIGFTYVCSVQSSMNCLWCRCCLRLSLSLSLLSLSPLWLSHSHLDTKVGTSMSMPDSGNFPAQLFAARAGPRRHRFEDENDGVSPKTTASRRDITFFVRVFFTDRGICSALSIYCGVTQYYWQK